MKRWTLQIRNYFHLNHDECATNRNQTPQKDSDKYGLEKTSEIRDQSAQEKRWIFHLFWRRMQNVTNSFAFAWNWTYSAMYSTVWDRCHNFLPFLLIRFRMLFISLVSECRNKCIPISMNKTFVGKMNTIRQSMYVRMAVNKNPIGFFQSNKNLQNLCHSSNNFCGAFVLFS